MTKLTPPPKFKSYIDRLLGHLVPIMHLAEYEVNWKFVDKIGKVPGVRDLGSAKGGFDAECVIDNVYLTIDISLSKKAYKKFKEGRYAVLAQVLVHELSHEYFDEMTEVILPLMKTRVEKEWLRKVEEKNTERVSRVIFQSLPRSVWMGPKV